MLRPETTRGLMMSMFLLLVFTVMIDRCRIPIPSRARAGDPVFPGGLADAEEVVLSAGDTAVVHVARSGREWRLLRPVRGIADPERVERLLAGLEAARRLETITGDELALRDLGPADYGLDPPRLEVRVTVSNRFTQLAVGDDAPDGANLFVRLHGQSDILVTDTSLLASVAMDLTGWRARRLLRFAPDKVGAIEWSSGMTGHVRLERNQGVWRLVQPFSAPLDARRIALLLEQLRDLQVVDFVWDPPDAPDGRRPIGDNAYHLGDTECSGRIGLEIQGLDAPVGVVFGDAAEAPGRVYARAFDGPTVVTVTNAVLELLGTGMDAFRDRRVVTVNPLAATGVVVRVGERRVRLGRDAHDTWVLEAPERARADQLTVTRLLESLRDVEAVRFVDGPTNDAEIGLAPPLCEVSVQVRGAFPTNAPAVPGVSLVLRVGEVRSGVQYVDAGTNTARMAIPAGSLRLPGPDIADPVGYRDRVVLGVVPDEIHRIERVMDGVEQALVRGEAGGWSDASGGGVVNSEALVDILLACAELRAVYLVGAGTGADEALGLAAPRCVLTLGLRGGAGVRKTITFGGGAGSEGVYARIRGTDLVFVLPHALAARMMAPLVLVP